MAVTIRKPTPVIMRVWLDERGVFAVLPTTPGLDGECSASCIVQREGVYYSGDYWACMKLSRQATEEEYLGLLPKLRELGYNPVVVAKATKLMHKMRVEEAKRLRGLQ